jgi:hypothetical protein
MWLYRRFVRIEQDMVQIRAERLNVDSPARAVAYVYAQDLSSSQVLEKIDRRRRAALRQYHAALDQLAAIEIHRRQPAQAAQPEATPVKHLAPSPVRFDKPPKPAPPAAPLPAETRSAVPDNPALRL